MTAGRIIVKNIPALDADGLPVAGAELRAFEAGTTIPKPVYSDVGLTTPRSYPVLADVNGQFPVMYARLHSDDDPNLFRITVYHPNGTMLPGGSLDDVEASVSVVNVPGLTAGDLGVTINAFGETILNLSTTEEFFDEVGALKSDLSNPDATAEEIDDFRNYVGIIRRELNPMAYGAVGDGAVDDYAAVEATLLEAAAIGYDVVFTEPHAIGSDLTIAAGMATSFVGEGKWIPASGVTITHNGRVNSDASHRFDISEGGEVDFFSNTQMAIFAGEWWGFTVGTTDDTQPSLQAALDAIPNRGTVTLSGRGQDAYLDSSIVLIGDAAHGKILKALSTTGLGGEFGGIRFRWRGADNGTMFDCRSTRSCVFEGFVCLPSDGVNVGANHAFKFSTPDIADGITSANILRDIGIYGFTDNASYRGVSIQDTSGQNGEFFILERVGIYHFTVTAAGSRVGCGFYNEETSTNAHGHILRDCRFQGFGAGIKGSMGIKLEGLTGFNANDLDIHAVNTPMPLIIENCNSENGRRFLVTGSAGGSPMVIRYNRIENLTPAGQSIMVFGSAANKVAIIGNKMIEPAGPGDAHFYDFSATTAADVFLEGNGYINVGGTTPIVPLLGPVRGMTAVNDLFGGFYVQNSSPGSFSAISRTVAGGKGADASGATLDWDGSPFIEVAGSPALETITVSAGMKAQLASGYATSPTTKCAVVWFFGTSAWTIVATGNIAAAVSVAANRSIAMVYDRETDKWYPGRPG